MKTDVTGRVKNTVLPSNKPLLPLYEALVNSIQAIEDAAEKNGQIKVIILRNNQLFGAQQPELGEISGFEVIDNGVIVGNKFMPVLKIFAYGKADG